MIFACSSLEINAMIQLMKVERVRINVTVGKDFLNKGERKRNGLIFPLPTRLLLVRPRHLFSA